MKFGSLIAVFAPLVIASCKGQAPAEKAAAPTPASTAPAPPQGPVVATEDFTIPLPEGYRDIGSERRGEQPSLAIVFEANQSRQGYTPTIVVRRIPIPGGSYADPATCAETGNGLATRGTDPEWILRSAVVVDGPVGKACQIRLLAPEGVALITELHRPGNTPSTPQRIWLMTCNHGDGDEQAEATCRSTLAGFRFRSR
jgi:hypothetical protein